MTETSGVSPVHDECVNSPCLSQKAESADSEIEASVNFTVGDSFGADDTAPSEDCTPSPNRNADEVTDEVCLNPEPPVELAALLDAESIGGTVFSKHWLFSTLMRLLQVL